MAALLRYLVGEYLEERVPEEHEVGIQVFGRPPHWVTQDDRIVSTNLRNLRDSLESYYATDGLNDPILVQFPKGSGCRATVSYAPHSPANVAYLRGLQNLRSFAPQDGQNAVAHFQEALAADPQHAPSHARMGQALCNLSWYVYERPPIELLLAAQECVNRAIELAPEAWESLVSAAVVDMCLHRWKEATEKFERALAINEFHTRNHLWFCQWLDITGRLPETFIKTERDLLNAPDDVFCTQTHVYSLYFTRRFTEAEELCRELLSIDRFSFGGHGVMFLISMGAGKYEQALRHAQQIHALAQIDIVSGLVALAHGKLGHRELAQEILNRLEVQAKSSYVTKFQLSAAYMGVDDLEAAVRMLEEAKADYDPWLMYLHFMPLFDPLRDMPRFRELLLQLGLPHRPKSKSANTI